MNLCHALNHWNGTDSTENVRGFFTAMDMPLPEEHQFTRTRDKGALVFLDGPACVLRLIDRVKFPSIVHPLVLQPLLKKEVGPFRIEISPGIALHPREEDFFASATQLIEDNIRFSSFLEIREDNFGYLPRVQNEACVAVVLDMDAIEDRRSEKRLATDGRQSEIFAPAIKAFNEAWPEDASKPDQSKLRKAWSVCTGLKQENMLVPSWRTYTSYGGDYKKAKSGGANYAAVWQP